MSSISVNYNDDEKFELEKIYQERRAKYEVGTPFVVEYLVKWKHYPKKFNQWVHTKDLHNI